MKKIFSLILALALSLCLFGCGDKENDPDNDNDKNPGGDVTVNPDGSIDLPIIDIEWDN